MRFDRFLTLRVTHPLVRRLGRPEHARVPILMYHSISNELGSRHPYYETNTSPESFDQQMKFLEQDGYSTVNLSDAVEICSRRDTGKKHVVITFDDGFRDFYTEAFPILRARGLTATMFVVTSLTGTQRSRFKERECLTWDEVRELYSNGIEIGSHTVTHPKLALMESAGIEDEIGRSKRRIEDEIGSVVKSFSYPYAFPETNHTLVSFLTRTLQENGYENGVSTIIGSAHRRANRFFLPRLPVNSCDDLPLFRAKLEGGYDWLHTLQYVAKRTKNLIGRDPGPSTVSASSYKLQRSR